MANLASDPNVLATAVGIVALALAPLAFLLWFFYTRDKLNPEPRGLVLKIFGLGLLAFIPVFLVRQFVPLPTWLMAIAVVPVLAELAKFWVVKRGVYNHPEFDEPVDGIIFAAAAGLGFATLEVIGSMLYAYFAVARLGVPGAAVNASAWTAVLTMFALRGLLSAPGQALWSSLWGYSLGIAKFSPPGQGSGRVRNGLLAAILAHAAFNALALESSWWVNRVGLVLVIAVLWFVVMRCLRYALALTPQEDQR
ncbi:PrsW family intramembrane metalloprotease [Nodosilinea sp. LEGE 06152]|uniref:PrsW family glutamic-type intramembrane protease n=1 Tax=Nodosilinea sp. LEGE 06152 TaxID=2777966 RepID=UPI0018823F23|nr:PrsW family glutamic-type intramembrane protease [Nodosilinea sp. LEGE 06152]MBE9159975.1 PrsW family intramembrane metalloprotease [Nodosilinea sp. LEGE 06152]